jgi:hypothetical protein
MHLLEAGRASKGEGDGQGKEKTGVHDRGFAGAKVHLPAHAGKFTVVQSRIPLHKCGRELHLRRFCRRMEVCFEIEITQIAPNE